MERLKTSPKESKEAQLPVEIYKFGKSIEIDIVGGKRGAYKEHYEQMSRYAAGILAEAIEKGNANPDKKKIVIGLAADTSPIGMLHEFAKIAKERNLDLSKVLIVRYEQGYGSGPNEHGPDEDFDQFHKELFFGPNGLAPQPAEIKTDESGKEYVDGNFIPLFVEYEDESSSEDVQKRMQEVDRILAVLGKLDFAVMGLGKDGHIIDWGRGENRLAVRHSREKKPEDYSFNYPRFSGDQEFRNYEWDDIMQMGADYWNASKEESEKINKEDVGARMKTSSTLGIKHIIGADEIAVIAPQPNKALAVKEIMAGSISGDLVNQKTGEVIKTIERDKQMRTPGGSVLSIRNTLKKPSRLILTPESAGDSL